MAAAPRPRRCCSPGLRFLGRPLPPLFGKSLLAAAPVCGSHSSGRALPPAARYLQCVRIRTGARTTAAPAAALLSSQGATEAQSQRAEGVGSSLELLGSMLPHGLQLA
eukprot:11816906-Alexandrium_andersonii.AAC.1